MSVAQSSQFMLTYFIELLCEDLWLNATQMMVDSLEFLSKVLQQRFTVLSVCYYGM